MSNWLGELPTHSKSKTQANMEPSPTHVNLSRSAGEQRLHIARTCDTLNPSTDKTSHASMVFLPMLLSFRCEMSPLEQFAANACNFPVEAGKPTAGAIGHLLFVSSAGLIYG